jgi:uncharacterized protein
VSESLPKPKAGFWRLLLRVLQLLVIGYLFVVLVVLIFQRRLIYLPTRIPADVIESIAAEHGFAPWKNPAGQIIGWKMPASRTATGSVLIVHGNAGCALSRDYIARPIHDTGAMDVYVLEYPGYGARPGSPSKASLVAAAEEGFQLLPDKLQKYVVSESIGTGVACELTKRHPSEISGLALLVPYDNLASVAQKQMPFLPAYFLLFDRFNPTEGLKNYHGPVKFAIAGSDEILGAASGRRLFEGYTGPKELQEFPRAGHNDVAAQSPAWWQGIFSFWQRSRDPVTRK